MPNRPAHDLAGLLVGGFEGFRLSEQIQSRYRLAEVIGSTVGGVGGSRVPDAFDTPTSPRHRGLAHGVAAASFVLSLPVEEWQAACRAHAAAHEANAIALAEGSLNWLVQRALVLFWHFLAGLLGGLRAGYFSHLALDAMTPMSLPLIGLGV